MASTTVLCRGIPLFIVPVSTSCGKGNTKIKKTCVVSVHQLSVQLWQRFSTPRVSVQKKIEELGIRLTRCDRSQVDFLRDNDVLHNFRATTISLEDAGRLCDALKRSREKRGLEKHPLKARARGPGSGGGEGRRKRREERWLLARKNKMSSESVTRSSSTSEKVVDRCVLIGDNPPPTPLATPPERAATPLITSESGKSPSPSGESLQEYPVRLDTLLTAQEQGKLDIQIAEDCEHVIGVGFNDSTALGLLSQNAQHISDTLKTLDALDLFVGGSTRMATLRSYLVSNNKDVGLKSSRSSTHISPSLSSSRRIDQNKLRLLARSHLSPPVNHTHHNVSVEANVPKGSSPVKRNIPIRIKRSPKSLSSNYKRSLHSPELDVNECHEEEATGSGAAEVRRCGSGQELGRKGERFLFLSSEDDEEVEAQGRNRKVAKQDKKIVGE